jgi:methionyl aminopeptidase
MSSDLVNGMRAAGKLAALTLLHLRNMVQPGITTNQLDQAASKFITDNGGIPAPLGYKGYPKSICTSVNEVVCHGIPDDIPLKEGDHINVDVTVILNGYHGDTSFSMVVGMEDNDLIIAARKATEAGIKAIKPGATLGDIGFAINKSATRSGFFATPEIGGHGINTIFHDSPFVPSYGKKGRGERLVPGMCITVEPLILQRQENISSFEIPNSEIYTHQANGSLSAQFEHTVLITEDGCEVLT